MDEKAADRPGLDKEIVRPPAASKDGHLEGFAREPAWDDDLLDEKGSPLVKVDNPDDVEAWDESGGEPTMVGIDNPDDIDTIEAGIDAGEIPKKNRVVE